MTILNNITTISEIRRNNYCGAWILKDRMILVKEEENHPEIAIQILNELFCIEKKEFRNNFYTRKYSIYRIMYRLGFIRLSNMYLLPDHNPFKVEFSRYYKPNEYQREIINKVSMIETMNIYYLWREEQYKEIENEYSL